MLDYTRILCALDFDEHTGTTLRLAAALAKESNATLLILHVARIPHRDMDVPLPIAADPIWEREARSRLEELVRESAPHDIHSEVCVVSGLPDLDIVRMALHLKADLIVMATHGRAGLSHLIMGSVAEHVIREAGCPVLILRAPKHA